MTTAQEVRAIAAAQMSCRIVPMSTPMPEIEIVEGIIIFRHGAMEIQAAEYPYGWILFGVTETGQSVESIARSMSGVVQQVLERICIDSALKTEKQVATAQ